ncbi:serine/threonine-protein kinase [Streptomyces sp. NPDC079189]|uniref:serine/threonine-protein kinase n=1 Tax=Streptomyces sp. NPDC079189 TaxID=3154514 RepID=UPI00342C6F0A
MGVVFAARASDGTRVAVKLIRVEYAADPAFRSRFSREVDLMSRVAGPCLVPLLDSDTDAQQPWLVTPYVPGPTLQAHVAEHGPLAGAQLNVLATGVAGALAVIHETGIVHRDLKPGNVILAPDGPRVLDFGVAHALDETSITRTGAWTGTPSWSSPEQFRGDPSGPPSDVFAWGALVAFAGTGRLPFGAGRPDEVAYRVMSQDPDLSGLPDPLRVHVAAALAKDPGDRPSAEGIAEQLGPLLAADQTDVIRIGDDATLISTPAGEAVAHAWHLPVDAHSSDWPDARSRLRRHWVRWLVTCVTVAAVATAAVLLVRPHSTGLKSQDVAKRNLSSASRSASPDVTAKAVSASPSETSTSTTPSPPATSASPSTPAVGSSAAPSCFPVTFKLPDGPADCQSKNEICVLGAPMYIEDLEALCGQPPRARVYVTNTDVAASGGCLALDSTSWATGTARYLEDAPAYQCNAYVDRTEADNGGQPLKVCQEPYPHTRITFLAVLSTSAGSMTACLTTSHGA